MAVPVLMTLLFAARPVHAQLGGSVLGGAYVPASDFYDSRSR